MRTITAIIVIIISFSIGVINLVIVNNSAIVFRIITLVQSLGIITIISSSISVIQLHHQQNHFFFFLSVSAFLTLFTTSITVIMAFFFLPLSSSFHSAHFLHHFAIFLILLINSAAIVHIFCHTGATTTNISVIITVYIYNIATCCISLPS